MKKKGGPNPDNPRPPRPEAIAAHQANVFKARAARTGKPPRPTNRRRRILQRTVKQRREAQELAYRMVTDPKYLKNLIERLRKGRAPHMEMTLWGYAFGKVPERIAVEGEVNLRVSQAAQAFKARVARLALTMMREKPDEGLEPGPYAMRPPPDEGRDNGHPPGGPAA